MDYLWPHNNFLEMKFGRVRSYFYTITGLSRNNRFSIGSVCHENGHMLCRFPDLYDYGQRDNDYVKSAGMGNFCLMGGGNDLNGGRRVLLLCVLI